MEKLYFPASLRSRRAALRSAGQVPSPHPPACPSAPLSQPSHRPSGPYLCLPSLPPAFPSPSQALKLLAKVKPASELQAALPCWAYLYGRLVMDNNRAVRAEASHVSAALAAAVGRAIAPLLKSLVPSWWLAQQDAYPEAAAAARAAFAAAFPAAAKQRDALLFCRAEVGRAGALPGCSPRGTASDVSLAGPMLPFFLASACRLPHQLLLLPVLPSRLYPADSLILHPASCILHPASESTTGPGGGAMMSNRFCARALTGG